MRRVTAARDDEPPRWVVILKGAREDLERERRKMKSGPEHENASSPDQIL
jgi:hypothetical protein